MSTQGSETLPGHRDAAGVAFVLLSGIGVIFLPTTAKPHPTAQDRLLAVLRNDAVINVWDLGCSVAGEQATNPSSALAGCMDQSDQKSEPESTEFDLVADQPKLLFKVPHQKKPNWVASSGGNERHFPSSFFVADISNDITAYTLPIIC